MKITPTAKFILAAYCLLFCLSGRAASYVTATVTATNATVSGNSITVNGITRIFTNTPPSSAWILNGAIDNKTATNLFGNFGAAPFTVPPLNATFSSTNVVSLIGSAVVVTIGGAWGTVSYVTNPGTPTYSLSLPGYSISAGLRTNNADFIVQYFDYTLTNIIKTNAAAFTNFIQGGDGPAQNVRGPKTFYRLGGTNTLGLYGGIYYSGIFTGATVYATGGYDTNRVYHNPILTNGINYGNAFRSPGAGTSSEQFGTGALATNTSALALGNTALAYGIGATALGNATTASSDSSAALGYGAEVRTNSAKAIAIGIAVVGTNSSGSIGVGYDTFVEGAFSVGIGNSVTVQYARSVGLGFSATVTATNQVRLGGFSSTIVSTPGHLSVEGNIINAHLTGTNKVAGVIAYTRYPVTSLANGNNAAVPIATNSFVEVSGPTGVFTINGIDSTGVVDGQFLVILNQTTFAMTVAHDSGTDPVAANRIYSLTGADRTTTGNGAATFLYSAAAARWILVSFEP